MRNPISKPNKWQALRIGFLALLVTLVVLELGIRAGDLFLGRGFFSQHRNELARVRRPLIPFRTSGFDLYCEEGGVRCISSADGDAFYPLQKPEGTFRIVCFGGSTTAKDPNGRHYPALLEQELRSRLGTDKIEVINVGAAGYATPHSLILLELDVLSWEPDLIILSHNINDLSAQYWPGFTFDYSNKFRNKYYGIPDYESVYTATNALFQHSQLYWFVWHRINLLKQKWIMASTKTSGQAEAKLTRRSYGLEPDPVAVEVFKRNLRSFVTLAKANRIPCVLGTQPLEPSEEYFRRHVAFKPYNDTVIYPLHEEFVAHHQAYNQAIHEVASEMGLVCVDNEAVFGGRRELFLDYVHYLEPGFRLLAQDYADAILENRFVPSD
ncbi:MAG: SGNH/GDSL hydrolase family protein [Candidatus Omnitrophica bacterium]|nr:SGNH/GDSL hydrolase family protein [Candidatus Omnitrophota bacterium]